MFLADLHIHSKYSRATAKTLDLEHLFVAAQLKGLTVVGTGDFTHPGWFSELQDKLIPTGNGLFKLRPDIADSLVSQVPGPCRRPVYFLLATEISNIYKKAGRTRKNHNLIFLESFESATTVNQRLSRIGNTGSDGRPILGLDARDLLEIVMTASEAGFLIPAHIWTPWFSLFGSKSGFDSIAECFEDLAGEIFAVETGLSSDPPMNWRISDLDGRTLVSNSDAHSPGKLAREATLFDCDLSYTKIRHCLQTGDPTQFKGTVEFYPEEGKYHFDGHRKCGVRFSPEQSRRHFDRCPRCGKPLTLGVLHRVEELADFPHGRRPERAHDFLSLVPLHDILAELLSVGAQSKKVQQAARGLFLQFGSEFDILCRIPPEDLDQSSIPLLGEAIRRMRDRRIRVTPGYDGEFGKVQIFDTEERKRLLGQRALFSFFDGTPSETGVAMADAAEPIPMLSDAGQKTGRSPKTPGAETGKTRFGLNSQQRRAQRSETPAILVVAGPGTGKTHTLTTRIAHMITVRDLPARQILAVTFTNHAAAEMTRRLEKLGLDNRMPTVSTFHGFCLSVLRDSGQLPGHLIDEEAARELIADAVQLVKPEGVSISETTSSLANRIASVKQQRKEVLELILSSDPAFWSVFRCYERLLQIQGLLDYEDLIVRTCRRMEADKSFREALQNRFRHLLIDEYQDLNLGQHRLVRMIIPEASPERTICAIGDPDQSIYGFRGSDVRFFQKFNKDYPKAEVISLSRSYRSTETILQASQQVIQPSSTRQKTIFSGIDGLETIDVIECRSEKAEAVAAGRIIEAEVGGTGFHSIDYGKIDTSLKAERSFGDFAVLVRTVRQMDLIEEVLTAAGIPVAPVRKSSLYPKGFRKIHALLRMMNRSATYGDVEATLPLFGNGMGQKTFSAFKAWAYRNRLSALDAVEAAWKVPVPDMARSAQKRFCEAGRRLLDRLSKLVQLPAQEVFTAMMEAAGVADAVLTDKQHVRHFETWIRDASRGVVTPEQILGRISMETDSDALDSRAESVALMTLHAAKGLEFPVVLITGCEDGLIPMLSDQAAEEELAEERRLFYVGMTRAKERLVLCWSRKRRIYGRSHDRRISPFLLEVERHLKREQHPQKQTAGAASPRQLELFE
jgi:uncharacterized protein (TIGR00375 family)